ncbi:MAG: hypothetical protein LBQ97_07085 [Fusobacteriaceae bacterium]|jgi:hypothetical protein|nr:hypothetical protein [Fusobacteriaceae bacterium]
MSHGQGKITINLERIAEEAERQRLLAEERARQKKEREEKRTEERKKAQMESALRKKELEIYLRLVKSKSEEIITFTEVNQENIEKKDVQLKKAFIDVYSEYQICCKSLGESPDKYSCSAESIAIIKEIAQEQYRRIAGNDFLNTVVENAVAETFQELGYEAFATKNIVKKSGKKSKSTLIDYGDTTAINVVQKSDGSIIMSIVGKGEDNTIPTKTEAMDITSKSKTFCGMEGKIIERLAEKGVIVTEYTATPPSVENVAKVNLQEYRRTKENYDKAGTKKKAITQGKTNG